jgi:uncharacterized cupredoxin-like copper-binding protein
MQRSRILLLATALSMLGAGAACGGGGDKDSDSAASGQKVSDVKNDGAVNNGGGSTVTITAKEFSFDQKDIKLVAGQAATIVLKNGGAIEHDITIDNPAFALKALPTKTEQKQITIPAAGSYPYYCSVPGHRVAGMEGTVTVS